MSDQESVQLALVQPAMEPGVLDAIQLYEAAMAYYVPASSALQPTVSKIVSSGTAQDWKSADHGYVGEVERQLLATIQIWWIAKCTCNCH